LLVGNITVSIGRVHYSLSSLWFVTITRFVSIRRISPCKLRHTIRNVDEFFRTNTREIHQSFSPFSYKTLAIVLSFS
jgi:hypothetical protein